MRLWSERDQARREPFERPEVYRVDLAEAVLCLKAAGVTEIRSFRWLDAPHEESLDRAERLLGMLGAVDKDGLVTEVGLRMARYPLSPQAARLLEAAEEEGCLAEACFVAAVLQGKVFSPGRRPEPRCAPAGGDVRTSRPSGGPVRGDCAFDPARWEVGIHARQARETLKLCGLAGRRRSPGPYGDGRVA